MKLHFYTPVYALTLLLSASLLFVVQPMFSKMILPLLGGTPQVWNTAMLFFQVMLLGGYAYAHGTTRFFSIRTQALLHITLLALFTMVLPIAIPEGWVPPVDNDPTLWQLSLMAITVGGPFFVLAGSAPMLQRWFAGTDHPDAHNPYFLYGASNLGSMTALLAYPVIIEPLMNLDTQSQVWSIGYGLLIICVLVSAFLVWTHTVKKETAKKPANDDPITWNRRFLWVMLAFIPSSLMLGVTTFLTTDIASVPLLWIMPLALYVGTFILVFARTPLFKRNHILLAQGILMIVLLADMVLMLHTKLHPGAIIIFHMVLFFTSALACHTELAASRPHARHLTEFYLLMSFGGALGGVFNALIAPNYFIIPLEYAIALAAVTFMRYSTTPEQNFKNFVQSTKDAIGKKGLDCIFSVNVLLFFLIALCAGSAMATLSLNMRYIFIAVIAACLFYFIRKRWLFAGAVAFVLLLFPPGHDWGTHTYRNVIHQDRNFFGVIKIVDLKSGERILMHGTTNHGTQALDDKYRMTPLSYYSPVSPIHDAFSWLDRQGGKQNVAVLGLGIGVTACFTKKNRHFDFFEIDPDIADVAKNSDYFTYLSDCGSPYDIILGDGRLTIADKPDTHYDMIVLDAFSSDNIPVHLMTKEAIALYLQKLKPKGILVFNMSNNYIDLEPVLSNAAQELAIPGYAHVTNGKELEDREFEYYPAQFFTMSHNKNYINSLKKDGWSEGRFRKGVKLWTDQYSNIISVLGNKTGTARIRELVMKERENKAEE